MSPRTDPTDRRRLPILRGAAVHFVFFTLFWALPVTYKCATNREIPWVSHEFEILYSLTSLFTHRTDAWYENYVQIKTAESPNWVNIALPDYDPLEIFGHGNRITRVVADSTGVGQRGDQLRGQIAQFIQGKHAELYPEAPPITEVRFVAARWPVGGSQFMSRPPGQWTTLPVELVPKDQLAVLSSHSISRASSPVGGDGLTDATLMAILKDPTVTSLDLSRARISPAALQMVFKTARIQTLRLAGQKLSAKDLSQLSKLPSLRELDLADTGANAQSLQALATASGLRVLKLDGNALDESVLDTLRKMHNLETLHLNYTGFGAQVLPLINSWPRLKDLQLAGAPEVRRSLVSMPPHTSLRRLSLTATEIADGDMLYLQRLPSLETLYLDHTKVSDQAVGKFRWCPSVRRLSLQGTQVTNSSLIMFSQVTEIEAVYLNGQWQNIQRPVKAQTEPPQPESAKPASLPFPAPKQP